MPNAIVSRRAVWQSAVGIGLALVGPSAAAAGRNKKKKPAEPAQVDQPIGIEPAAIVFGMAPKAVADAYAKIIDEAHVADFDNVEPGVEMQRLEEQVRREKEAVRKSLLLLDEPPTTLDGTKLVGEFTYGNKEAIMRAEVGKKRTLFFIRGKLWKLIDAYPLGEGAKWGADFKAASDKLKDIMGVEGRALPAGDGRRFDEADWADAKTHLRAINWGKQLAVAYVDRATEARLPELRTAKGKKPEAIDPAVKDVLRK